MPMTMRSEDNYVFKYRYRDASVPPEYHRSYTIRVTPERVYLSVDSYGTILLEDSFKLKPDRYQSFVAGLLALDIRKREVRANDGCAGGTTDHLELFTGQANELKGSVYHCARQDFGDLEGNVAAAVELFKGLVPDLVKKVQRAR
jgi:hypothetical protein